jgi:DNA-binding MarR family transcriptional regulator
VYALSATGFRLQEELQEELLAMDRQLFEGLSELELFQLEDILERIQRRIPYVVR